MFLYPSNFGLSLKASILQDMYLSFVVLNLIGSMVSTKRTTVAPQRPPPPPPTLSEQSRNGPKHFNRPTETTSSVDATGGPLGAFWSTQHAKDSQISDDSPPIYDEPYQGSTLRHSYPTNNGISTKGTHGTQAVQLLSADYVHGAVGRYDSDAKGTKVNLFRDERNHMSEKSKPLNSVTVGGFQNEAFSNFVAEFDTSKLNSGINIQRNEGASKEELEAEVEKLKEDLKKANLEKAEISSRYDKLTAICRSQRQEIQDLKATVAAKSPSTNMGSSKIQTSPGSGQSSTPVIDFCFPSYNVSVNFKTTVNDIVTLLEMSFLF